MCYVWNIHTVGSSPCLRGTRRRLLAGHCAQDRFIPVLTGNAIGFIMMPMLLYGSSPCLRGTPTNRLLITTHRRFIPVLTGNARWKLRRHSSNAVHPRAYGERDQLLCYRLAISGSSPCLRGTPLRQRTRFHQARFIPVLTGNAREKKERISALSVHPRAYGERHYQFGVVISSRGSSPCLRGTLVIVKAVVAFTRFIPVLTGNAASIYL